MADRAFRVAIVAALLAECGCTTVTYDGPRLPRNQVARLTSQDVKLKAVDTELPTDHYVEVLPGEHAIRLSLESGYSTWSYSYAVRSRDVTICFTAEAGHFYSVKVSREIAFASGLWRPVILDTKRNVFVEHPCAPRAHHQVPAADPVPEPSQAPSGPPVPQKLDPG